MPTKFSIWPLRYCLTLYAAIVMSKRRKSSTAAHSDIENGALSQKTNKHPRKSNRESTKKLQKQVEKLLRENTKLKSAQHDDAKHNKTTTASTRQEVLDNNEYDQLPYESEQGDDEDDDGSLGTYDSQITECKSHARRTLRDKTCITVITGYGLEQGLSSKAVKNNRALVVRLLGDRQAKRKKLFFWKDVEGPSGFAKHTVFTEVFRTEFFKSRTDAGVTYVDHFRPVSLPFLGLLFTVVKCCLEEWRDGHLKKIKFSEVDYRKKYEENLENL
ncbi:hypothetical protein OBBRIDRAFT_840106 [Obba rivulosa]|uniref:DUF6532 domain-containing protein n=1 Tax=Obba rivulosa TaxID=1052685 RepID=A0A8E2ARJ6_9APHY|nr:hypothetical protein OBBRIDRAFT_840106 [Obba rivulosa]